MEPLTCNMQCYRVRAFAARHHSSSIIAAQYVHCIVPLPPLAHRRTAQLFAQEASRRGQQRVATVGHAFSQLGDLRAARFHRSGVATAHVTSAAATLRRTWRRLRRRGTAHAGSGHRLPAGNREQARACVTGRNYTTLAHDNKHGWNA